jgi:hypothetical protein
VPDNLAKVFRATKRHLILPAEVTAIGLGGEICVNGVWKSPYICLAIDYSYSFGECSWVDTRNATRIIQSRLERHVFFGAWLLEHVKSLSPEVFQTVKGLQKLQRTRHAWIDSLIKEFE